MKHVMNLLTPLLDGEVTGEDKRKIEEHLRSCSACGREWQFLQRERSLLKTWQVPPVSRQVRAGILEKVRREAEKEGLDLPWLMRWRLLFSFTDQPVLAAAGLMLFCLAAGAVIWQIVAKDTPREISQAGPSPAKNTLSLASPHGKKSGASEKALENPRENVSPASPLPLLAKQNLSPENQEIKTAKAPSGPEPETKNQSSHPPERAPVVSSLPAVNPSFSGVVPGYSRSEAKNSAPPQDTKRTSADTEFSPTPTTTVVVPLKGHSMVRNNVLSPGGTQKAFLDYTLDKDSFVSIKIFSSTGQIVTVLVEGQRPAGSYEAVWDGTSQDGQPAASGVYYLTLQTKDYLDKQKIVVVR